MSPQLRTLLALAVTSVALAAPSNLRGAVDSQAAAESEPEGVPSDIAEFTEAEAGDMWEEDASEVDGKGTDETEVQQLALFGPPAHSDKVKEESKTCADPENAGCGGCYLYRRCAGHSSSACVINGYLVVAGRPLRGMEDINSGTARSWDFLWNVARSGCDSDRCVLITNPVKYRSQHQMHIHFRHYKDGGAAMKKRLESALCGTSDCTHFDQCGSAKARLYDHMPHVFSEVAAAYGGGSLRDVGVTVWFTSACGGGQKTMLLATTRCSIERGISNRRGYADDWVASR